MNTIRFKGVLTSSDASGGAEVDLYTVGSPPQAIVIESEDQILVDSVYFGTAAAGDVVVYYGSGIGAPDDENLIIGHHVANNGGVAMTWPLGAMVGRKGYKLFADHSVAGKITVVITGRVNRRQNS